MAVARTEKLLGWRHSPAYERARAIGETYATYRDFALEGVARQWDGRCASPHGPTAAPACSSHGIVVQSIARR